MKFEIGFAGKPKWVWKDFDMFVRRTRARVARAHYLSGLVLLASARTLLNEFNARAKVAREAPFHRNVENPLVFLKYSASAREQIF